MEEYVFGANILENLTTGMYQDSRVIYREYIQNACDQIDKAYDMGLLRDEEGCIDIWFDAENRTVSIVDNATGIPSVDFERTLANIANSDKRLGEDKGFRGIGRLCGLAYCKELIFTSKAAGEDVISIMHCDAAKMRELIIANERGEKHTASEVLHSIYKFEYPHTDNIDAHSFKVELVGINEENTDLLDFAQIKEYLSFVAPVPYQNTFIFRSEIYKYAEELNYHIDEYTIRLEGEQIFKKYKTNFKTSKGDDEVFNLAFKKIYDSHQNLLAWLWIGVSHFKAVISKDCQMRGLRLRKENIQIGDDDALQKLFKEDRGHHYFIGEVFAVSKNLIPNSQRDYFNENPTRLEFERELRRYFNRELYKIYYEGSAINSAYSKIDSSEKKETELQEKKRRGDFVNDSHYESALADVERAKESARKAADDIEKKKQKAASDLESDSAAVISQVISRLEKERKQRESTSHPKSSEKKKKSPESRRVDKLSSYSRNEKKLISKIFGIILTATDDKTAEMIIKKIEDGLQ
ncbi:MAG: ATP-binding protein [Lachnospiraceae bacterium]|nr:ATP-binding protein [Lachnospiraceae bacterium]